jgi:ribonuclease Z
MNRREMLKLSGLTAGSLAVGSAMPGCSSDSATALPWSDPTQQNSLLAGLPPYHPGTETLGAEEMCITFLGTTPIAMISQAAVSVFVELGNGDCLVFDLGTGSMIKYWAMKIDMDKIYKVFIAHLHADHMGDIPFVYGFGPSYGRLWPMYIWGPTQSGLTYYDPNGTPRGPYKDGTADYCSLMEQMLVWHNESQSFESTSLIKLYQASVPVGFDTTKSIKYDAYDIVAKELPWQNTGKDANGNPNNVAYNYNGMKITNFPAVHTREGAISYKLEWTTPSGQVLSMIYVGDTLPSQYMIDQAKPGVDVLIHEMVVPASVWVSKLGLGSGHMNVPKYWMPDPTTKQPTGAPQAQLDPNAVANYVIDKSKYSKK